jgi:glycosyltransferase involved in cell wall biosynthesis
MPPGKTVTIIPYGVDVDAFHPEARPERMPLVIGSVARLSPEKGLEYLLRAVALLRERADARFEPQPNIEVLLAGDGPARERLEDLTAELRIDSVVRFLGEIAHEEVPAVLQRFDIFAMPSTWEGFGVAALEASAMQLPIIASDIHGIPDVVINGETGILTPPRDVEAIAGAMSRLMEDADLRRTMGAAGRAFVERHYRWRDNAVLMERLYEKMLAKKS